MYNISKMASWKKITIHLQKYWAREVLGKFPVMQHLRFGTLFPMSWQPSQELSRRQLEYEKPPEADNETNTQQTITSRGKSHMAQGYLDEFTSIKDTIYYSLLKTNRNGKKSSLNSMLNIISKTFLDIISAIRNIST